jgi:hypothetical protein
MACHLGGEFGYQDAGPVTSQFTATEPVPGSVKLDDLVQSAWSLILRG